MTEDRMMVAKAVLFDGLDASYLTMEEIRELEDMIFEAVAEKRSDFQTFEVMQ